MTELDHIHAELRELREQGADTQATAARIEERLANFTHAAGERARKNSDRVDAVDGRVGKLEQWRWVLVGAWVCLPIAWTVFQALQGQK